MSDKKPARVIVWIGEQRLPKKNEYFWDGMGFIIANFDFKPDGCEYTTYTRHNIDVPDEAMFFIPNWHFGSVKKAGYIPLPPVRDPLAEKILTKILKYLDTNGIKEEDLAREIAALVREGGVK